MVKCGRPPNSDHNPEKLTFRHVWLSETQISVPVGTECLLSAWRNFHLRLSNMRPLKIRIIAGRICLKVCFLSLRIRSFQTDTIRIYHWLRVDRKNPSRGSLSGITRLASWCQTVIARNGFFSIYPSHTWLFLSTPSISEDRIFNNAVTSITDVRHIVMTLLRRIIASLRLVR